MAKSACNKRAPISNRSISPSLPQTRRAPTLDLKNGPIQQIGRLSLSIIHSGERLLTCAVHARDHFAQCGLNYTLGSHQRGDFLPVQPTIFAPSLEGALCCFTPPSESISPFFPRVFHMALLCDALPLRQNEPQTPRKWPIIALHPRPRTKHALQLARHRIPSIGH